MEKLIEYSKATICQNGVDILKDVDMEVAAGDFVYIIGKVGSGKSTLLQSFYDESIVVSARKAEVLGRDMLDLRRRDIPRLRREMGIIFQDFQLLADRDIGRNLRFVLRATGWKGKQEIESRIDEVLSSVGMSDCRRKMPHELSGGEQQRIAIARSLLNEPKLIIADEPTANLDMETADNILTLLGEIRSRGTAVVMSTHNLNIVEKHEGRIYECVDGKLIVNC